MPRKKKEDASFGPRLAALRKARGLTQVQLAEATRTTQRSISYYENDDGVPPSSIVVVLAQALRVSADELLGLKQPPPAGPVIPFRGAGPVIPFRGAGPALNDDHPETRRLWKRFQMVTQLPEKDQRAVIRLINSLAAIAAPRQEGHHDR